MSMSIRNKMLTKECNSIRKVSVKCFFILLTFCIFLYASVEYYSQSTLKLKQEIRHKNGKTDIKTNEKLYSIDTIGCKIPDFNALDEHAAQYIFKYPKIICCNPLFKSSSHGTGLNSIIFKSELESVYNISNLNDTTCVYKDIKRKTDNQNKISTVYHKVNTHGITYTKSEFIEITCWADNKQLFYKDFEIFVTNKPTKTLNVIHKQLDKVSVMIIGIDSISRLNFRRQLRLTSNLLFKRLNAIEFYGHNKVGDNTFSNVIPALTGLDDNELNMSCLPNGKNSTYDNCPFIWKQYKRLNYQTVFAEDIAQLGLFNFHRKGFSSIPTDYYLRPIILAMEKYVAYNRKGNIHQCLGCRKPIDILFDYIRKLTPLLKKNPFFSFFWSATISHDFLNMPSLVDEELQSNILFLNGSNILNNTVLFLMSGHGLRWGSFRKTYQGMMEERLPFLFAIFPEWFKKLYPDALLNFKLNARKLTTHFDLHATLTDLANLKSITSLNIGKRSSELLRSELLPRGISLFLNVPKTRTCENAGIAAHWCTCNEKQLLATNDARVQRVARFIVKNINEKISSYPQCRTLSLNAISEAAIATSNVKFEKEFSDGNIISDITIKLQTKPGLAEFEATVRMTNEEIFVSGSISRINIYGKQKYCVNDYKLKMFCYCER